MTRRERCEGRLFLYTVKPTDSDSLHDPYMVMPEDDEGRPKSVPRAHETGHRGRACSLSGRCGVYHPALVGGWAASSVETTIRTNWLGGRGPTKGTDGRAI